LKKPRKKGPESGRPVIAWEYQSGRTNGGNPARLLISEREPKKTFRESSPRKNVRLLLMCVAAGNIKILPHMKLK
jgi:hypothetical protein